MGSKTPHGQSMNSEKSREEMPTTVYGHMRRVATLLRKSFDYYEPRQLSLDPEERCIHITATGTNTSNILTEEGQQGTMIEPIIVGFLNSEGGTLILGVGENNKVEGIPMSKEDERQFKRVFENSMTKVIPQVFPSAYFVDILRVNRGRPDLRIIEITVEQGKEAIYQTHLQEIFVRIDGSLEGPLDEMKVKKLKEQRIATAYGNAMLQTEVGILRGRIKEIDTGIENITNTVTATTEVNQVTQNAKKLKEDVEILQERFCAIEEKNLPDVTNALKQNIQNLSTRVEAVDEDNENYKIIQTTQTTINNETQETVTNQKKITKNLEKQVLQLNDTRDLDELKSLVKTNREKVDGWHKEDEVAMNSLQAAVDKLNTLQKNRARQDETDATKLLELAQNGEVAIKKMEEGVGELDKKIETKTAKSLAKACHKELKEWHDIDFKEEMKPVTELVKIAQEEEIQQQNDQETSRCILS